MPYTAAYIVYAAFGLDANFASDHELQCTRHTPPLLYVYWCIHITHLAALFMVLSRHSGNQWRGPFRWSSISYAAPWALIALVILIPGAYLEFPSDPWQHLSRINEWGWLQRITEHSAWYKSGSFLAYSLVCCANGVGQQRTYIELYFVGSALLLLWQYFRLAIDSGIPRRWALLFVIITLLTFGNSVFSFYRYYGISTTLIGQIAAVALVREGLRFFRFAGDTADWSTKRSVLVFTAKCVCLLALAAANHVQAVGLGLIGITMIAICRLVSDRRVSVQCLLAVYVLLNTLTIAFVPKHPLVESVYRNEGWLSPWYGFAVLSPKSAALARATEVLGDFGWVNAVCGLLLLLLRRKTVIGWLTVGPFIALVFPFPALFFANALAGSSSLEHGYVIAFHRMFFAAPPGLAIATLTYVIFHTRAPRLLVPELAYSATVAMVALGGLLVFADGRGYSRVFNLFNISSSDLRMDHIISHASLLWHKRVHFDNANPTAAHTMQNYGRILTNPGIGYVLNATGASILCDARKRVSWPDLAPPSAWLQRKIESLPYIPWTDRTELFPDPKLHLYTPGSISAKLSGHWLPTEVALEHIGGGELSSALWVEGRRRRDPSIWLEGTRLRDKQSLYAQGPSKEVPIRFESRGTVSVPASSDSLRTGDLVRLRPVMRSPDGNGWQIAIRVEGPDSVREFTFATSPDPTGGEKWTYGDCELELTTGKYIVILTGRVAWPDASFVVEYTIDVAPR